MIYKKNFSSLTLGEDIAEDWLKDNGHVAIINVWRPTIKPVERSPLGFIDINSFEKKVSPCNEHRNIHRYNSSPFLGCRM